MLKIKSKDEISNSQKTIIVKMIDGYLREQGHSHIRIDFMSKDEEEKLLSLNDRLADVLCTLEGFEIGLHANPNGNKKQRDSLIKLCDFMNQKLKAAKELVHVLS